MCRPNVGLVLGASRLPAKKRMIRFGGDVRLSLVEAPPGSRGPLALMGEAVPGCGVQLQEQRNM